MSSPTDRSGRDDEDEGPKLRAFLIVITVLSVAAIGLRFWSRAMKPAKQNAPRFWWDDWLALSVLVSNIGEHSKNLLRGTDLSKSPYSS